MWQELGICREFLGRQLVSQFDEHSAATTTYEKYDELAGMKKAGVPVLKNVAEV